MLKYVNPSAIEEDEFFPYDFEHWNYSDSLLRSTLYSVWWTEIDDDTGTESALLMDYDGFVEWFDEKHEEWLFMDDSVDWSDCSAHEYLTYHLGRTVCPVKEV